jgi:hypothetical protein
MPAQPARAVALFWFALVTVAMIALVGAVTLTAEATLTPSPTPFPTFTNTSPPFGSTPLRPTRTHTPRLGGILTASPTYTASPTHTPTPAYLQCAWQWAREPLWQITRQAQEFLTKAEFRANIHVENYGENCIDYRGGTPSVAYFAAMTTDFYLNTYDTRLPDAEELAADFLRVYALLLAFIEETELPARPGYLSITFNDPGYMVTIRAMFEDIQRALDDGLTGQALLETLGGWPVTPMPQST